MKRTLILILCAIMLTSCMMLGIHAAEETTEATTEDTAPAFDALHIVFNSSLTGKMNVLESINGMEKGSGVSKTNEWDGVKLEVKDSGDPHVSINYAGYIKKSGNEKQYIENNPYMVLKVLAEEIAFDDFEIYYCIGDVLTYTEDARIASDYAIDMGDGTLYFIFDLSDAEGEIRNIRIDINGAEEGALMYLTDMIFLTSEEEALDWCGYSEDEETTEAPTEAETDAPTEPEGSSEIATAPPATEDDDGCGGMIGAGLATVSLIALGAACIKKKD